MTRLVLIALVSCLAACGGAVDDATPATDQTPAAAEQTPVFDDDFESGETAEWQEPSGDDDASAAEEGDPADQ